MRILKSFVFISIIFCFNVTAQDKGQKTVGEKSLNLKGRVETYFISNNNLSRVLIFDTDSIRIQEFPTLNTLSRFSLKGTTQRKIVGYSVEDNITLYHRSPDNTFFFTFLESGRDQIRQGVLNFQKPTNEVYLSSFTLDQKFYILTITKKSSLLNFYAFESFFAQTKKTIDLSKDFGSTLFKKLKNSLSPTLSTRIDPFDDGIEISSKKIIVDKSDLFLTIDTEENQTLVVNLSISNFSYSYRSFDGPKLCSSPRR